VLSQDGTRLILHIQSRAIEVMCRDLWRGLDDQSMSDEKPGCGGDGLIVLAKDP